jgi:hypothetical protein
MWDILAVQMSQSGQLTLELPYVIIGLGPTPNFVEKLTVGVPPNSESVCPSTFANRFHKAFLFFYRINYIELIHK